MFDPRSPYHRRRWHYDSDQPLSVAQIIAAGSLDARTAALLWVLIERHRSLIVSGPTDPTPGVGKTTTLNALLGFLPVGSTLVYTAGLYEDFDFVSVTDPATTCVLANEVSDHLPIYMWGRVARKFLRLPADGYAVATSCHADTMQDVLHMLQRDLRLGALEVGQLGVVVNIGLVGHIWPPRRRFLTVHYLTAHREKREPADDGTMPAAAPQTGAPALAGAATRIETLRLAEWDDATDTILPATPAALARLAEALSTTPEELSGAIERRHACLETLSAGRGTGIRATREAIEELVLRESGGSAVDAASEASAPTE
ncbi:MAG: hypothetical protein PVSMB4_13440 [Ktedonobacterales bacterium]